MLSTVAVDVIYLLSVPVGANGKEPACQGRRLKETWVLSLGREDPLEEGMATHLSILAWRIQELGLEQ